jgi:hypothetical protein
LPYPPEGYGPDHFPEDINPLTGLRVSDPSLLDRRPLGIKVNIVPRSSTRPPWGLSFADIVYDFYHNDGYSRFHAIFYGEDAPLVGPIRSGRLPDDPLVRTYDSIFVYGGADAKINYQFTSSEYSDRLITEGRRSLCPPTDAFPLCREDPNAYDFLLGGTQEIHAFVKQEGIDDKRQNLDGMFFQLDPPADGETADQITIRYSGDSYARWEYDPKTEGYLRFQDAVFDQGQGEEYSPLTDRVNDEQIAADNVVVLFAPHEYFQRPPAEIIEILLSGGAEAYAFRDGKAYDLQWVRPASGGSIYLTFPDGDLYPFKPGKTWFQIVGESSVLTKPESGAWRFEFKIP